MAKQTMGSGKEMFETTYILNPALSPENVKSAKDKFRKAITANGGTIAQEEDWGLRKLAYKIGKQHSGHYVYIEFSGSGDIVAKLEREYTLDENLLRFLTIKMDKYAFEYSQRRRDKLSSAVKEGTATTESHKASRQKHTDTNE